MVAVTLFANVTASATVSISAMHKCINADFAAAVNTYDCSIYVCSASSDAYIQTFNFSAVTHPFYRSSTKLSYDLYIMGNSNSKGNSKVGIENTNSSNTQTTTDETTQKTIQKATHKKTKTLELDSYFIDETPHGISTSIGFSKNIFKHKEWMTLKSICAKKNITQNNLNSLFNKYLSDDGVYLRNFRVKTNDVKVQFMKKEKILQELAELFIPMIYLKDFNGLDDAHSPLEISFARFTIMNILFCLQSCGDVIYDFLSILRQRLNLQVKVVIFTYNLKELLVVLTEDLKASTSLQHILTYCNIKNDNEISILNIIRLGIRYPLMFYQLFRFRYHFMRLIFGDMFWEGRRGLKPRIELDYELDYQLYAEAFVDESTALIHTATAIITDLSLMDPSSKFIILEAKYIKPITRVDRATTTLMKNLLGYKKTRLLIIESKLPYDSDNEQFIELPTNIGDKNIILHDPVIQLDFQYNVGTGIQAWAKTYYDPIMGSTLRQNFTRIEPNLKVLGANAAAVASAAEGGIGVKVTKVKRKESIDMLDKVFDIFNLRKVSGRLSANLSRGRTSVDSISMKKVSTSSIDDVKRSVASVS